MNQETAGPEAQRVEPVRNFSVLLSPTSRGARLARLLATEQLRSWGLPLSPADQIVAELANNAATHGRVPGRNFRLTLYVVGETLRIEVTDTSDDLPHKRRHGELASSGRGLMLIELLADLWGVDPQGEGKSIWFEFSEEPDKDSEEPGTPDGPPPPDARDAFTEATDLGGPASAGPVEAAEGKGSSGGYAPSDGAGAPGPPGDPGAPGPSGPDGPSGPSGA